MIRLITIYLLIILKPISLLGFSGGDSLIMEGARAFYNYDFDRSIKVLNIARDKYPTHPGVHFIWASAKYYISQARDETIVTYDTLKNSLDHIDPIYEKLVADFPNNQGYKLYFGSSKGLRARSSLGKKEWISVLIQSYTGFKIIKEVANKNPEMVDAQLPIGIVEYYASISNPIIKFLVGIYGLDASKYSALEKISNAAKYSDWAWIEASGVIAFIYLWIENDPGKAILFTDRLNLEFPNNYYYRIIHTESLIKNFRLDEAWNQIDLLEKNFKNLTLKQRQWYGPYLDYEKSLILFYEKKYNKSFQLIEKAILNYNGELDMVLGNLFLLKGKILDIWKRHEEAKDFYKECIGLANFSYAISESKKYLISPFILSENEK
tara:strand:- start:1903 stop:3039 length:1137 start_codon:yes stop_codon:yes gene_type:complete